MITAVIFDLSEVYLSGLLGIEHELSLHLGLSCEEVLNTLNNKTLKLLFEGKISEDEYWRSILQDNAWNIELSKLKDLVRANFKEIEGTREIIEGLKKKGFKLGLLSVHSKEWIQYCENKYKYHELFDSVCYSFENSICKPDKSSYEEILGKLDVSPNECLFIDDSEQNVLGAKVIGMQTILFESAGQLGEKIQEILP